ncbi:acetyltransferase [Glutamicibacter endophyticus]|uniref:acetyltransferase n=1 Tax=Glutamicibacter endophyticus TaxID=1522174 RepID=UPI003AF10467
MHTDQALQLRAANLPEDIPSILQIWRSAVEATHHFLSQSEIGALAELIENMYLDQVQVTVALRGAKPVGFSGLADGKLEMLFVAPEAFGCGVGSALVHEALAAHPHLEVDVNEQNPQAHGFYTHLGFEQIGRSELDGQGNPYPLLHLRYSGPRQ